MDVSLALSIAWFVLAMAAMAALLARMNELLKQLKARAPETWRALGQPESVGDLAPDRRWRRYLRERQYLSLADSDLSAQVAQFARQQRLVTVGVVTTGFICFAVRWMR